MSAERFVTGAILAVVGGVVVAAIAAGRSSGTAHPVVPAPPPPTTSARAVVAGDVRDLPPPPPGRVTGTLDLVTADCSIDTRDLRTGRSMRSLNDLTCDAWFSPSGDFAIASMGPRPDPSWPLVRYALGSGDQLITTLRPGSEYEGPPAIADDGTASSCTHAGLTVQSPAGRSRRFPSLCASTALGRRIVALSANGRAILDPASGRTLYRLPRRTRIYNPALVASRDGSVLGVVEFNAASGYAEVLRIDTANGTLRPAVHVGIGNRYHRLAISNDGRMLALLSDTGWNVWNLDRGRPLQQVGSAAIRDVAFSPDSRSAAIATGDGIVILDAPTLAPRYLLPVIANRVAWRA